MKAYQGREAQLTQGFNWPCDVVKKNKNKKQDVLYFACKMKITSMFKNLRIQNHVENESNLKDTKKKYINSSKSHHSEVTAQHFELSSGPLSLYIHIQNST